ncbi:maestro heat-like repeat-containing protein family member 9 isoform X2 [Erinaceus europaeus]|uniref:Maestro heat-like repeat-containing protein family member 9 isoform X2 n=1 Tax=Erinaceus europaeus TaxID=9365 RepID=A0ABM3XVW8_ERIEU|nr:maestro heat-like repeat-containing protein family member 9 isoform X2 [Erinaceus europaeus]
MIPKTHKSRKSSRYSGERGTSLQILHSTMKWLHIEQIAAKLWDTYSALLSHQAMILAMNSSFVDPLIQFESQLSIIESTFKMLCSIPTLDTVKDMGKNEDDKEDLELLYRTIFNLFEDTLLMLVYKDLYKLQILKEMITWMNQESSFLQERAMTIISRVLSFASRKVKGYTSVDAPCLGVLAAELSLLCTHSDPSITQQASLGMYHLLCIAKCQNDTVKTANAKNERYMENSLPIPPAGIEYLPKILQQDKTKIAQNIGQALLPGLLTDFVWSLLIKIPLPNVTTAYEAAILLTLTLEYYAQKITMVSKIMDEIYKQLQENSSPSMKQVLLWLITLLTRTSPKKVIFHLMDYSVPANSTLILMWQAAGLESQVAPQVLKTILLILKGKPGEKHKIMVQRRRLSVDSVNMMPVAASQALSTLLPLKSYKKAVAQFFPQLLMALLLQQFYSSEVKLLTKNTVCYAQEALRTLLTCSGLQEVDSALKKKNCWSQFSQTLFHHHSVYLIAKTLSEHKFPQFPETLRYLYKLSVEDPRRSEDMVITIIFLTELLNNFFKDPFPEEFLSLFRNWVNDPNPAVCKLSLQKIATMAPVINETENVCNLLFSIIDAFFSKDNNVVIRALLTLRRLLIKLDKTTYSSLCSRIASSYYPLMDHSNAGIRSMAIRHFGELLQDMSHHTRVLNDLVIDSLVPLILFLEDTEKRVFQACMYTLEVCASSLHWFTTHLLSDEYYSYELVVLDICNNILVSHKQYITELLSDALGYLRSSRAYLRRASIILVGYFTKLSGHLLLKDEIEVISEAIDRELQDEDPVIVGLAKKTQAILQDITNRMTSSNIKQCFQRIFNTFYIKRLKPLYYYNLTCDLNISSMKDSEFNSKKADEEVENEDISE